MKITEFAKMMPVVALLAVSGCVSASLDDAGLNNSAASASSVSDNTASVQSAEPVVITGEENTAGGANSAPSQIPVVSAAAPEVNDANRQRGVAEIRAKAAQSGNNPPQLTEVAEPNYEQHMSKEEQRLAKEELRLEALAAAGEISDAEFAAKRAQISQLRKKARAHYQQALNEIEN